MLTKLTIIGLLAVSCVVTLGTDTYARVCLVKQGGSCVFWSGSVSCENLNASGVGNVRKDPKNMQCSISSPAVASEIPGLVFCANNGGNVAPGAQASVASDFGGISTIFPGQVDKNGFASGINVKAELSDTQLATLDQFCQNDTWFAIDFVPCAMQATVTLVDEDTGEILGDETFDCQLPQCETLAWDKKAQTPERRQYQCGRL